VQHDPLFVRARSVFPGVETLCHTLQDNSLCSLQDIDLHDSTLQTVLKCRREFFTVCMVVGSMYSTGTQQSMVMYACSA